MSDQDPLLHQALRQAAPPPARLDDAHRAALLAAARQAWFRAQRRRRITRICVWAAAACLAIGLSTWTLRPMPESIPVQPRPIALPHAGAERKAADDGQPHAAAAPLVAAMPAAPMADAMAAPAESQVLAEAGAAAPPAAGSNGAVAVNTLVVAQADPRHEAAETDRRQDAAVAADKAPARPAAALPPAAPPPPAAATAPVVVAKAERPAAAEAALALRSAASEGRRTPMAAKGAVMQDAKDRGGNSFLEARTSLLHAGALPDPASIRADDFVAALDVLPRGERDLWRGMALGLAEGLRGSQPPAERRAALRRIAEACATAKQPILQDLAAMAKAAAELVGP